MCRLLLAERMWFSGMIGGSGCSFGQGLRPPRGLRYHDLYQGKRLWTSAFDEGL